MDEITVYEPLRPSRLMIRMILVSALIMIVIGIVYHIIINSALAAIPFALGVLATSGLNILKLRMLDRTVQKVINIEDQAAGKNIVRFQYLLRYFMTGVVLVIIGLIHNYTTPPPVYNLSRLYIAVWAAISPGAPEALLTAPFISIWGALFGIFTLQLSVILVRSLKLEKDGEHFVKYEDDDDSCDEEEIADNSDDNGLCCTNSHESIPENSNEQSADY